MKTETRPSIAELEERIAALPPDARAAAERIFSVSTTASHLVPPPEMHDWITKQFGSVDAVTTQQIVRVTNTSGIATTVWPMVVPRASAATTKPAGTSGTSTK